MSHTNLARTSMPQLPQWLLALSNLALAAAVAFHVFIRPASSPVAPGGTETASGGSPEASSALQVDLEPLAKPMETLDRSLAKFSATLQRFNTSIVQYDFLQKEMERLARLDQALGMRLNLETAKQAEAGDEPDEELAAVIGQIRQIQAQVQQESTRRRETMLQLIAGLERELVTSGIDEQAVREAIGDIPPPADANPAPAPASSGAGTTPPAAAPAGD
jgi:hypothetical protein